MQLIDPKTGIEVLDRAECIRLLGTQQVGRIAVVIGGRPIVLPVNYVLDGEDVVFRTADGTKFDAAVRGATVGFEIDHLDSVFQTGWSVLVGGRAELITDAATLAHVRALPLRPWSSHDKSNWVRVPVDEVTGRRVVSLAPPETLRG
jgi:nitroimidazol reductase NimA-like FMN-containing flavoprotein (pyridoxamine 5'-phosphate oxidase superfamily)